MSWTDRLPLLLLRATLTPERPWRHDEPALALRGALGRSMLHLGCVQPVVDCRPCPVARCVAADWYDPSLRAPSGDRPFWLRAMAGPGGRIDAETPLRLAWTFLGAPPRTSLLEEAVHRAAQMGIGPDRIRHHVHLEAWDGEAWRPTTGHVARPVPLTTRRLHLPERGLVVVHTASRLRLRRARRWLKHPRWSDVIEALVLRIRQLERALGREIAPTWPAPDPGGEPLRCRWVDADRWSSRQDRRVDLSGALATWRVDAGKLGPWRDLVSTTRALQVGRGTTGGSARCAWWWRHESASAVRSSPSSRPPPRRRSCTMSQIRSTSSRCWASPPR